MIGGFQFSSPHWKVGYVLIYYHWIWTYGYPTSWNAFKQVIRLLEIQEDRYRSRKSLNIHPIKHCSPLRSLIIMPWSSLIIMPWSRTHAVFTKSICDIVNKPDGIFYKICLIFHNLRFRVMTSMQRLHDPTVGPTSRSNRLIQQLNQQLHRVNRHPYPYGFYNRLNESNISNTFNR